MALTLKKRLFADAVKKGASNTEAAVIAGYSEKTAPQAGSRLVKDPDVITYLAATAETEKQVAAGAAHVKRNVTDPREALIELLNDPDKKLVMEAAKTLMPYYYCKLENSGKKETQKANAKSATSTGRFATLGNQELAADKIQ